MTPSDNIHLDSIPLAEHESAWRFTDENGNLPPAEHLDQIFPLKIEAAIILSDLETAFRLNSHFYNPETYFKHTEKFIIQSNNEKELKKWLFNRGIPFSNLVFLVYSRTEAVALTWKMILKYWDGVFLHDTMIWDRTVNWCLFYDHNDVITFGRDRIYNGEAEQMKINDFFATIAANKTTTHNTTHEK